MSNDNHVLDFSDLTPRTLTVPIGAKKYILHEPMEDAAMKYLDAGLAGVRMADGKITGFQGSSGTDSFLVSMCLYEADENDKLRVLPNTNPPLPDPKYLVKLTTIRGWPHRVQKSLSEWLKEAGGLKEKPETRESLTQQLKSVQQKLKDMGPPASDGSEEVVGMEDTAGVKN